MTTKVTRVNVMHFRKNSRKTGSASTITTSIVGSCDIHPEYCKDEMSGDSGAPTQASHAWDRAPYSWNMVYFFSFGCHEIDRAYVRAYVRTYASTDCTGGVGETIKRKGGVSQACLGKSTSFILDIHNMVN